MASLITRTAPTSTRCFFSFLLLPLTPAGSSLLHLPAQVSHYHTCNGICCLVHNVYPHDAVMCTLWALLYISLVVLTRFLGLELAAGVRSERAVTCRTFDIWSADLSVAHGSKTAAVWRKSAGYLIAGALFMQSLCLSLERYGFSSD